MREKWNRLKQKIESFETEAASNIQAANVAERFRTTDDVVELRSRNQSQSSSESLQVIVDRLIADLVDEAFGDSDVPISSNTKLVPRTSCIDMPIRSSGRNRQPEPIRLNASSRKGAKKPRRRTASISGQTDNSPHLCATAARDLSNGKPMERAAFLVCDDSSVDAHRALGPRTVMDIGGLSEGEALDESSC